MKPAEGEQAIGRPRAAGVTRPPAIISRDWRGDKLAVPAVTTVPRISLIAGTLLLALQACHRDGPVDNSASKSSGLPNISAAAPSATGEPHADTQPAKGLPPASSRIPAELEGRWSLTPADCIAGRSATKALLVIGADGLRFNASSAVPAANVTADSNSISGDFAFDGEGRSWTKYEALKVAGRILVRTEMNPTATFTYAKCD